MYQKGFASTELSSRREFTLQMTFSKRCSCLSWHLHSYSTPGSLAHTCPLQASSCWNFKPKLARNVRKKHQISQIAAFLSKACGRNLGWSQTSTTCSMFDCACWSRSVPRFEESNSRGHDTSHPGDDQWQHFWQKQGIIKMAKKVSSINPTKKKDDKIYSPWIFESVGVAEHNFKKRETKTCLLTVTDQCFQQTIFRIDLSRLFSVGCWANAETNCACSFPSGTFRN